jgi:hypothetical protein
MRDNRFDMDAYRTANPWRLINVRSIGTMCGRYATEEEAIEAATSSGGEYVGTDGHDVLFAAAVRL